VEDSAFSKFCAPRQASDSGPSATPATPRNCLRYSSA
jgi:hypothetical protein